MEPLKNKSSSEKEIEDLKSTKYLLGDFGVQILLAIGRGARTKDAILMLSGVPKPCISGRIPVLLSLNLIAQIQEEYYITERGKKLIKILDE
jgi:predicted transcriptional regulator